MRLLITGAGGAGMQLLSQAWARHFILGVDADPGSGWHIVPLASDPTYCDAIWGLVAENGIDLVIPCVDEELPVIERLRMFNKIPLLLPDQHYIVVMLDKLGSMRELKRRGVDVPETWITKPRQGRGSRGVTVTQELMEGTEYTVMMCADQEKRLHGVVPVRVLLKRGITIRGMTEANPRVIAACQAIHEAWPTFGTYNVQGIDDGKQFRPFEINPRLSTTTGLGIAAGVDPLEVWQARSAPRGLLSFKEGLTLYRTWRNTIV